MRTWWKDGVLCQIYPRSYRDTNGDGHGDIPGITEKLPYLEKLGVEGIWLDPIFPSPNIDWGYDVSDYMSVQPDLGTLEDVDNLISQGQEHNIQILLDIVPNHTSDQHPWFLDALTGRDAKYRDFYVWVDGEEGIPPNNWVSMFGGSAWQWHEQTKQYYLRNFTPNQPDLNWWNPDVRQAFKDILSFWFERGVGGFRVDVCQALIHDKHLRDNSPATPDDRKNIRLRGQRPDFSMNRPEVHDILKEWRLLAESYPKKPVLLGETNTYDLTQLAKFYGDNDELHMAFNFPFMGRQYLAQELKTLIEQTEKSLPSYAHPVWTMSNHDAPRFVTRWCNNDPAKIRGALMLLLTLRGTPMLYYGDELGLPDAPAIPVEISRDYLALGTLPGKDSRDPCRAPMPWNKSKGAGFCDDNVTPWLPCAYQDLNVEKQLADPSSTYHFTRKLIELRKTHPELYKAPLLFHDAPDDVLAIQRGSLSVFINLSDKPQTLHHVGRVLLATEHAEDNNDYYEYELAPWQGIISSFSADKQ